MKILFGFIAIIIVSSLFYFFTSTKNDVVTEETVMEKMQNESPGEEGEENTNISTTEEKETVAEDDNKPQGLTNSMRENDDNEQNIDAEDKIEQTQEEIVLDESDIPEYSEEVSGEDFKEFITVALEELSGGEEMAEAIITEMQKIAQAQPNHIDQVKYFYRECSQSSTLSIDNQRLCKEFLDKINGR